MSKFSSILFFLLFSTAAHAGDVFIIQLDSWIEYIGAVSHLRVDLCNPSETVCTRVKTMMAFGIGEELFADRLAMALDAEPRLAKEATLRLRWGYFNESPGNIEPLLTARIGLNPAEVRQGRLDQIDLLDGTYLSQISCRVPYRAKMRASPRLPSIDGVGYITESGCDKPVN